jgi:hypothetical protein
MKFAIIGLSLRTADDFPRPGNEQGGEVVSLLKYGNKAPFAIFL